MAQVLLPESLVGDPNGPLFLELRKLLKIHFNQLEATVSKYGDQLNAAIEKEFKDDQIREGKLAEKDATIKELEGELQGGISKLATNDLPEAEQPELPVDEAQPVEGDAEPVVEGEVVDEVPADGEVVVDDATGVTEDAPAGAPVVETEPVSDAAPVVEDAEIQA